MKYYQKLKKYAIPAFNVVSFEMIIAAIQAAEAQESPIIIEYTENDGRRIPLELIGNFASTLAKDSKVPICVHLDHGQTFPGIVRAIKSGYSSVMFDGSALTFEENIYLQDFIDLELAYFTQEMEKVIQKFKP